MGRRKKEIKLFNEQKEKEYILIDWSNLVYTVYSSFMKNLEVIGNGENLIMFNLIRKLNKVLKEGRKYLKNNPEIIFVFDRKPIIRKNISNSYKGNRKENVERLDKEFKFNNKVLWKTANELLNIIPIKYAYADNYEADDVINTLTLLNQKDSNIIIFTRDRDLFQIIKDNVIIIDHKDYSIVDKNKVYEIFNVYPWDLIFYKTIFGDTGDNIPNIFKRKNMRSPNKKKIIPIIEKSYCLSDLIKGINELTNKDFSKEIELNYNLVKLYAINKEDLKIEVNNITENEFYKKYNEIRKKYNLNKIPSGEEFLSNLINIKK